MSNETRQAYVVTKGDKYLAGFDRQGAGSPKFSNKLSDAQMYSSIVIADPFRQLAEQKKQGMKK